MRFPKSMSKGYSTIIIISMNKNKRNCGCTSSYNLNYNNSLKPVLNVIMSSDICGCSIHSKGFALKISCLKYSYLYHHATMVSAKICQCYSLISKLITLMCSRLPSQFSIYLFVRRTQQQTLNTVLKILSTEK